MTLNLVKLADRYLVYAGDSEETLLTVLPPDRLSAYAYIEAVRLSTQP